MWKKNTCWILHFNFLHLKQESSLPSWASNRTKRQTLPVNSTSPPSSETAPLCEGLAHEITLEGGDGTGEKSIRWLLSSSNSFYTAWNGGQLSSVSNTQGLLSFLTWMLPEYTCTFTFLGENVSFDFLPVYVLVPTTKMLREPKWTTTQKRWSKFQNVINKIAHKLIFSRESYTSSRLWAHLHCEAFISLVLAIFRSI